MNLPVGRTYIQKGTASEWKELLVLSNLIVLSAQELSLNSKKY